MGVLADSFCGAVINVVVDATFAFSFAIIDLVVTVVTVAAVSVVDGNMSFCGTVTGVGMRPQAASSAAGRFLPLLSPLCQFPSRLPSLHRLIAAVSGSESDRGTDKDKGTPCPSTALVVAVRVRVRDKHVIIRKRKENEQKQEQGE